MVRRSDGNPLTPGDTACCATAGVATSVVRIQTRKDRTMFATAFATVFATVLSTDF